MSPRRRYAVAILLLVSLLVGAFVLIDFQLMTSTLGSDSSVGTSQLGDATAPVDDPLTLVVLEDGALAADLETALAPRFGEINTTAEPTPSWSGSVLVVSVSESTVQYNPLAPHGQVSADFAFVGSGNATFATSFVTGDAPLVITNAEPYVVHGTVSVTDRSRGIVSVPGYRSHLRGALADELARAIGTAPGMD